MCFRYVLLAKAVQLPWVRIQSEGEGCMEQFSRSQRLAFCGAAVVLALVFALAIVYFTAFAPGHPHFKHDLLLLFLGLGSLIIAWFAWPPRVPSRD